jgi:MFS family permease
MYGCVCRLGRGRVFWVGLWLLGLGTVGFGLGANWGLGWCLAMRGVQGIGAAAVNVAGNEPSINHKEGGGEG